MATDGGTALAEQARVSEGITDGVWRRNRDQFFIAEARNTSRMMFLFGCLVQVALVGILAVAGYPTWRVVTLASWYALFALSHRLVIRNVIAEHKVASAFIVMNVTAQLFVIGTATLTGGIR